MRLHNWAFDDPSVFERVYGSHLEETGAPDVIAEALLQLIDESPP